MENLNSVWCIFACDFKAGFPNFYPVAVYKTRNEALDKIKELPTYLRYDLFELPFNKVFAKIKNGKLQPMLGLLHHEHYNAE